MVMILQEYLAKFGNKLNLKIKFFLTSFLFWLPTLKHV